MNKEIETVYDLIKSLKLLFEYDTIIVRENKQKIKIIPPLNYLREVTYSKEKMIYESSFNGIREEQNPQRIFHKIKHMKEIEEFKSKLKEV